MLKTNCKIVKQRIRQHIYDCIISCLKNTNNYNVNVNSLEKVYTENLHGKSIYLFTLYYDKDMKDYFVRYKKD